MKHGEMLRVDALEILIVPVQLVIAAEPVIIHDVGHLHQLRRLFREPAIRQFAVLHRYHHIIVGSQFCLITLHVAVGKMRLTGLEQLVPEQRLDDIEVDMTVAQEVKV